MRKYFAKKHQTGINALRSLAKDSVLFLIFLFHALIVKEGCKSRVRNCGNVTHASIYANNLKVYLHVLRIWYQKIRLGLLQEQVWPVFDMVLKNNRFESYNLPA